MAYMLRSAIIGPVLAVLLLTGPTSGRDIFVNNEAGDNSRNGRTARAVGELGGPVRSISKALTLARAGDRVVIAKTDTPYREGITLQAGRHSGTPEQPFEVVGNGAILNGRVKVPPRGWQHFRGNVFRYRPKKTAHQLLFLGNKLAKRKQVKDPNQLPTLAALEWCLFRRHLYFCVENGKLPDDYDVQHTGRSVGITLYEVRNVVIRDLVIEGFQLDGVNAHDSVFGATLLSVTCRSNARSGISVGGASRVFLNECRVKTNGKAQLRTEGFSRTRVLRCELADDGVVPAVDRRAGKGTIEQPAGAAASR